MEREITLTENSLAEDRLTATAHGEVVQICVCEPWSGDTEAGFGQEGNIKLAKEQARTLGQFLCAFADS